MSNNTALKKPANSVESPDVTDMKPFHDLIEKGEEWLMNQILEYAKQRGYSKYTSTLKEAWRLSISGLSGALIQAMENGKPDLELSPKENYSRDPITSFGVLEAKRHRERGIDLGMFLGLMKYYRQSYVDLLLKAGFDPDYAEMCRSIIERFFDRVEMGFCIEWSDLTENEKTKELQDRNRRMTNEKNKYLTIFESIQDPVILLDREKRIDSVNHAWVEMFDSPAVPGSVPAVPGSVYYNRKPVEKPLQGLSEELVLFIDGDETERVLEKRMNTRKGVRDFQVKMKRMLDISDKYRGIVIILNDISEQRRAEEDRLRKEKLQGVLEMAGAVCHELNQPLQVILGQSQLIKLDLGEDHPCGMRQQAIIEQIDRIGMIIKKLMRITRYETKDYLESKIIDIDKASKENPFPSRDVKKRVKTGDQVQSRP